MLQKYFAFLVMARVAKRKKSNIKRTLHTWIRFLFYHVTRNKGLVWLKLNISLV